MGDPVLCCLLGVCCPPLERREKIVAHYLSLGLDAAGAERVADDLIARVDAFLLSGIGALLKDLFARGKAHKD